MRARSLWKALNQTPSPKNLKSKGPFLINLNYLLLIIMEFIFE